MSNAVHLISKPNAKGDLERLTPVGDGTFRTCCWALTQEDAANLKGGWLYLHETKAAPSRFGGRVLTVERVTSEEFSRETRFAFVFAPHLQAKRAVWRGRSHGMAWTGGLVAADLPHESG